jgi:hypothetical protein
MLGGGSGVVAGEEEEEEDEGNKEDNGDEGGGGAVVSTERTGWDGMVVHGPSTPETSAEDAPTDEREEVGAGELLRVREQLMTASKPDMSPHHERNWTFDFDMDSGEETPARLTDSDTDTSAASEDTWRPSNMGCPYGLEDHEVGPGPRSNPGPPFAVGDVIMCDAPGHLLGTDTITRLQRAFVLKAEHPRYRLRLESGATIWTHTGESWLKPRWAPGEFAENQDDPFKDERVNQNLKTGSYGIHIDAQLESLRKIKEAKEFAKAVK